MPLRFFGRKYCTYICSTWYWPFGSSFDGGRPARARSCAPPCRSPRRSVRRHETSPCRAARCRHWRQRRWQRSIPADHEIMTHDVSWPDVGEMNRDAHRGSSERCRYAPGPPTIGRSSAAPCRQFSPPARRTPSRAVSPMATDLQRRTYLSARVHYRSDSPCRTDRARALACYQPRLRQVAPSVPNGNRFAMPSNVRPSAVVRLQTESRSSTYGGAPA